jgi:hypothetical protein
VQPQRKAEPQPHCGQVQPSGGRGPSIPRAFRQLGFPGPRRETGPAKPAACDANHGFSCLDGINRLGRIVSAVRNEADLDAATSCAFPREDAVGALVARLRFEVQNSSHITPSESAAELLDRVEGFDYIGDRCIWIHSCT